MRAREMAAAVLLAAGTIMAEPVAPVALAEVPVDRAPIVFATFQHPAETAVQVFDGDGNVSGSFGTHGWKTLVGIGDVNNDGVDEIVTEGGGLLRIYDASGALEDGFLSNNVVQKLVVIDVNGDGADDIVTLGPGGVDTYDRTGAELG